MKVTEHLEAAKGKALFSFEIVPPQKGSNIKDLYANIDPLMEFKPPFIDAKPLIFTSASAVFDVTQAAATTNPIRVFFIHTRSRLTTTFFNQLSSPK